MKLSTLDKFAIFFAEVIGTGILLFLGCAGCIPWSSETVGLSPSITFGMAVMMVICTFGSISGAHLNPAVTVAAVCYKIISVQVCKTKLLLKKSSKEKSDPKHFAHFYR